MRLIDIDDVSLLKSVSVGGLSAKALWRLICKQPTVDAVPVVRCKDCKYSVDEYDDGECYCDYENDLRYIKDWNHHCSWAERKEE